MELLTNKQHKFSITLKENDSNSCTYRIDRKLLDTLKKYLEPFRTFQAQAKKIKCVETGKIFNSAREACHWVEFIRKTDYCDMNLIKQACKGRQKTSYGYHWEFVNEDLDKFKAQLNERINNERLP